MLIELKKNASGKFESTPPEELQKLTGDMREMGEHQNTPISGESIFEAANKGYQMKQEQEGHR